MRQVIEGKVYDSEKAELIHEFDNGMRDSDFEYVEESLYRTDRGAYFIAGHGGAMTEYSTPTGSNSWTGGSGIRPVSPEEAAEWLETHDGTAALIEHFGQVLEEA